MLNNLKHHASAGEGSGKGSGRCGEDASFRIPKNKVPIKDQEKEPGEVSCLLNKKKECERCTKWKTYAENTHWTDQCKAFEANGTPKRRQCIGNGKRRGVKRYTRYNITTKEIGTLKRSLTSKIRRRHNGQFQRHQQIQFLNMQDEGSCSHN